MLSSRNILSIPVSLLMLIDSDCLTKGFEGLMSLIRYLGPGFKPITNLSYSISKSSNKLTKSFLVLSGLAVDNTTNLSLARQFFILSLAAPNTSFSLATSFEQGLCFNKTPSTSHTIVSLRRRSSMAFFAIFGSPKK